MSLGVSNLAGSVNIGESCIEVLCRYYFRSDEGEDELSVLLSDVFDRSENETVAGDSVM